MMSKRNCRKCERLYRIHKSVDNKNKFVAAVKEEGREFHKKYYIFFFNSQMYADDSYIYSCFSDSFFNLVVNRITLFFHFIIS